MKKKKIIILIDFVLYIIFAILYSSKGFALMLAEETTKAHVVYNKYGKSYSYLNFKPISEILYKVGALGIVLTGIIFIVLATYVTYREIMSLKTVGIENAYNYKSLTSERDIDKTHYKENIVKKYSKIVLIALIYALIIYLIPSILEVEIFSEVGTEGVYFELF